MDFISIAAGSWWYEFWNSIWLLVCQGIYIFIGALYQVYEKVASVNLFSREIFEEITGRIYVVIGVAMLFIFAYNLILLIINPEEKKGTSNMTKVIQETIISLVLVVLLPTIFNYLYVFQTHILESNIIGNIVLGNVGSTSGNSTNCEAGDYDCSCNFEGYGLERYNNDIGWRFWESSTTDKTAAITTACQNYKTLTGSQRGAFSIAPTVFSAFYRPAHFDFSECVRHLQGETIETISSDEDKKICINYFYDVTYSKYKGDVRGFVSDTYLKDIISDSRKDSMEFHWIMAVVAGVLALYMFFCYSMEVGVRVAKLGFLQLISPIPVMMRIIPGQKEKMYQKWFNHLTKTYVDVFIRVLIIDFALFGISLVPDVINTMWNSSTTGDGNFFVKTLATVFVILGILKFAQDAPALFKEFFGDAGSFKLRSPAKQLGENKLAMGGLGMMTGGLMGAAGNYHKNMYDENGKPIEGASRGKALISAAGGLFGGARRGAVHGTKAKNWDEFKSEMKTSKYETDAARKARMDRKELDEALNIPLVGGVIGQARHNIGDFKDFVNEDGSSNLKLDAATEGFNNADRVDTQFKKPNVQNIENTQKEYDQPYQTGQPVNLDGKVYEKLGDIWKDSTGVDPTEYTQDEFGKHLADFFKDRKRGAYADNYAKTPEILKAGIDKMLKDMPSEINKLGESFSETLFKELNKTKDSINDNLRVMINNGELSEISRVSSVSDITKVLDNLQLKADEFTARDEKEKSKEIYKAIYDINDSLKTSFKNEKERIQLEGIESRKKN